MTYNATERIVDNMNEAKLFGDNLKQIRTKKGISQGDIARALGVHKGYISNIENGKVNPTLSTIIKLARATKASPRDLLSRL